MTGVENPSAKAAVRRFSAPLVDRRVSEQCAPAEPADSVARGFVEQGNILACPRCGGGLKFSLEILECGCCGSEYRSESGIPRLFFPHDVFYGPPDVTHAVKDFYEANPFPKYADADSRDALRDECLGTPLGRLLEEQLAANALILDAGCGTGHLANFLGLRKERRVIGADLSLNSLRIAKKFKDRCGVQNVDFLQMNLFRPPFRAGKFDAVIANSVLHYTTDPLRGFRSLAALLKPDGLLVLGLYNLFGRVGHDLRRSVYRLSRDRLAFLRWRNEHQRRHFIQRYKQPYESRHSLGEVTKTWFAAHDFEFLYSSPRIGSQTLSGEEDLRYARWSGDRTMRLQTEFGMLLRGMVDEGLFVMIGRKKSQPKRIEASEQAHATVA
jgi:SAM-dependent methyltransferase